MSPSDNGEVPVFDESDVLLLPTSPALARKLLKEGKARVRSKEPFTIILTKNVESPNITRRYQKMKITDLHTYFSSPRPVYIQNISDPIGVVSLEFKRPNGEVIPYRVPPSRDPILLTNVVPFDAIKDSAGFFALLQPSSISKAKLQLITSDDAEKYFRDLAEDLAVPSVEQVKVEAQNKAQQFNTQTPIVSEHETRAPKELNIAMEPTVSPRVQAVCQQLDPSNSNKITPAEAISIFNSLEPNLAVIDYDYILANTYDHVNKANGLVRKWALKKQMKLSKPEEGIINSSVEDEAVTASSERVRVKK